jgi:hypothetical protein
MTHAALSPDIGREFDPFLFASVGEDRESADDLATYGALKELKLYCRYASTRMRRESAMKSAPRVTRILAVAC